MRPAPFLALTCAAMLASGAGFSQSILVEGRLLDDNGNPIAGYPVILENQASIEQGYSNNVGFTSETGAFSIAVDQVGGYTAIVPDPSFTPQRFEVDDLSGSAMPGD